MNNKISEYVNRFISVGGLWLYCQWEDKTQKVQFEYSVTGLAVAKSVDKLGVLLDEETHYVDPLTQVVTSRFDNGYYNREGLLVDIDTSKVVLESFTCTVDKGDNFEVQNREMYLASQPHKPSQSRIVYPNGKRETNPDTIKEFINHLPNQLPKSKLTSKVRKPQGKISRFIDRILVKFIILCIGENHEST